MSKKINPGDLIERFNEKHSNYYDYSLMTYIKMNTKIKILCPIHGIFEQSPLNHLHKGCIKCGIKKVSDKISKTTEEFINESNKKHNFLYEYNHDYVNWKTKVIITCKKHGDFTTLPLNHIKGQGCKICKKEEKTLLNPVKSKIEILEDRQKEKQDNFIKKCDIIHSGFYSYKNTEFTNITTKVEIVCPTHGSFLQSPFHHLRGSGCYRCGLYKKSIVNIDEYKKRCFQKFGNKFKYSNYEGIQGHVLVECPLHGINRHLSYNHLKSNDGCKYCSKGCRKPKKLKYTKEEIIEILSINHSNKYDHSNINYTGSRNKIIVICPNHGEFDIQLTSHLNGCGCKKCAINDRIIRTDIFIERSNKIHNNKYNYSLSIYEKGNKKINIICPAHGIFKQTPDSHMRGSGCSKCFQFSRGERIIKDYLIKKYIYFEQEKTFKDLNRLRFDFYLPQYNLCIEFDGRQHFKPTEIYGGEEGLQKQIYRDNMKNEYCKNNMIELLRISYKEIKKINDILDDKFKTKPIK